MYLFLCFYLSMNHIVYKSYKKSKVRRGDRACVCVFVCEGGSGWKRVAWDVVKSLAI